MQLSPSCTITAGELHNLNCTVIREDIFSSSTFLEIIWLDNNNDVITNKSTTTINGVTNSTDTSITSILTFPRLRTSQAGRYTCAVNMTIPGVVEDHQDTETTYIHVRSELNLSIQSIFCFTSYGSKNRYTHKTITRAYKHITPYSNDKPLSSHTRSPTILQ